MVWWLVSLAYPLVRVRSPALADGTLFTQLFHKGNCLLPLHHFVAGFIDFPDRGKVVGIIEICKYLIMICKKMNFYFYLKFLSPALGVVVGELSPAAMLTFKNVTGQ